MSKTAELKKRVRRLIKARLADRQQKKYFRLLEQKNTCYNEWIHAAEEWINIDEAGEELSIKNIPYEACKAYMTGNALKGEKADIIIFSHSEGEISGFAERLIGDCFNVNPSMDLAYGDEDVKGPDGTRYTPWLKPDWSPDTFYSYFYFGSIFAVRTRALLRLTEEQTEWIWQAEQEGIWRLCFLLAGNSKGFEKRTGDDAFSFPIGHIDEIIYHSRFNREMELETMPTELRGLFNVRAGTGHKGGMVSVIIPSKDNPEILKRCIRSVRRSGGASGNSLPDTAGSLSKAETDDDYEIIVVDNGSTEKVKLELTSWLAENGVKYIYEERPFNFSRMCNRGAEAAAGNVLLFLNDDAEVIIQDKGKPGFLQSMCDAAMTPYTGAVGAKLYYPNSYTIQHAGIVNQELGPVHKLQFKEDNRSYYYGWNRKQRNVIAVTGACLAVGRDKFTEAGGFPLELSVAFNDVDLCFSLFEKGYYNVVLQDVILYHHESLSRGSDEDKEKLGRLMKERDKLYERHPLMYERDPFYHKYFASDILTAGFELKADYPSQEDTSDKRYSIVTESSGITGRAREDACVIISLEYAGQKGDAYLISGYSFVTGSDNACYEKAILLQCHKSLYVIKPEVLPRRDVEDNLPDQLHAGLTGFRAYIREDDLQDGTYRIGMMEKDKCTGVKIYSWTNRYLTVNP